MKRLWMVMLIASVGLLAGPGGALAQMGEGACPVVVETALLMVERLCGGAMRNQVCYGHVLLEAEPQPGVESFTFAGLGDIADVAALRRLRASPMDAGTGQWGVALMRLQADLPDTLPGQNVTVLLFGDVDVTNAGGTPVTATVEVTVQSGAVVVDQPSLAGMPLADPLPAVTTLPADGRLMDDLWVHLRLPDGRAGWVMSMMVSGDLGVLPVMDMSGALVDALYGPMQAFYFTTGMGDAPCAAAPESGLLIQTPEGAGSVRLRINEATVVLGSTAFLQASAGGEMAVNVVDGQAQVTAFDVTQTAPAGTRVRVPLGPDQAAAGPPSPPEPVDPTVIGALPLGTLAALGGAAGGEAVNLIQNGDFAAGMSGWTVEQPCDACGMQINIDPDPAYGDYLAWARDTGGGMSGSAIWARQTLDLDATACTALHIAFDVRADYQSLPNSGWWSDEHGGNGEYPALVRLAFMPAFQGSPFDWARGFLYRHDGATRLTNYTLIPQGQWTHFEADVLAPEWWKDGFDMALTNPGRLTDVYVGGSGWDFIGGIDNIVLTATGCGP